MKIIVGCLAARIFYFHARVTANKKVYLFKVAFLLNLKIVVI